MNNRQVENLLLQRQQIYSTPIRFNQHLPSAWYSKTKTNKKPTIGLKSRINKVTNKHKRRALGFPFRRTWPEPQLHSSQSVGIPLLSSFLMSSSTVLQCLRSSYNKARKALRKYQKHMTTRITNNEILLIINSTEWIAFTIEKNNLSQYGNK